MTFIQSPFGFAGYQFPTGFRMTNRSTQQTTGLRPVPFQFGAHAPAGRQAAKTVTLEGVIGGNGAVDSSGAYILTRDQAVAELNLLATALQNGYGLLTAGNTGGRTLKCQPKDLKVTAIPGTGQAAHNVVLELYAPDPRWLAPSATTLTVTPGSSVITAASPGSTFSYPKITFSGAFTFNATFPLSFLNSPNSQPFGWTSRMQLTMFQNTTLVMAGGDTLVIDCDPENRANCVQLNGVNHLEYLNDATVSDGAQSDWYFPIVWPGNNFAFCAVGNVCTMAWKDAWAL